LYEADEGEADLEPDPPREVDALDGEAEEKAF
jgi:hypothetical protein